MTAPSASRLVPAILFLLPLSLFGQNASGSLAATVYDASGAVVPGAKVVLRNEATNDLRETVSNGSGFFDLPAIRPGSYTVSITARGFAPWEERNIVFNQGENRTLPNIALQVGSISEQVRVGAEGESITPIDTGEARETLDSKLVSEVAIEGRNATELLKIMPGVAMNHGLSQYPWTSMLTQSNSGPAGQYVASGTQPYGSMTITMDGANIVDPGNQGGQVANINQSQTQEVTMLTSAYGAEYAKGPVSFQAVGKSGTAQFHGALYFFAHSYVLDSADAYAKSQGATLKPSEHYYYPGGEVGGPVLIPGLNFNRKRDKLFFYIAPEGMDQLPPASLAEDFIPTPQMLGGNFSPQYLASLGPGFAATYPLDAAPLAEHGAATAYPGGMIPPALLDSTSLAYAKLFPKPSLTQPNDTGNNFFWGVLNPVDRVEFRIRLDYNVSDSTKLFGTWNIQREADTSNVGIWYYPGTALPYPSTMKTRQFSNIFSANLVHSFGPNTTNETVATLTRFINPYRLTDPAAVDPAAAGLSGYQPLAKDPYTPQIPNVFGVPGYYAPSFGTTFDGGAFGKASTVPSVADNFSHVIGRHAMKFGVYWDFAENQQTGGLGDFPQGTLSFGNTGTSTSGNVLADFLTGRVQSFQQVPAVSVYDLRQNQYSFYAQDQWKAGRKLTLTYGLRLDHIGQWYPLSGQGLAVWNPASYDNTSAAGAWTGLLWHGIDDKIPMSGFVSRAFYPEPRFGLAYDVFGNGRTVVRGGIGVYRYALSFNSVVTAGIYNEASGIPSYDIVNPANFGWNFAQYAGQAGPTGLGGNMGALEQGDSRVPRTETYDFIVDQRLPWQSRLEIEYSGNQSQDLLLSGNGAYAAAIGNLNKTPIGAYFLPDPVTGVVNDPTAPGFPLQDYRPYRNYQTMELVSHGVYQNYNALIASWNKKSGPITIMLNYTFSKVLGIRDGESDNGATNGTAAYPWNLKSNYGVLPYDHTQLFNAVYVLGLPRFQHSNLLARLGLSGWMLAGITHFESGAPIQPNTGGNLYLTAAGGLTPQMWLGTDSQPILPVLTCDPRSNLQAGQYFNPGCFALAPKGQNGPAVWPYIHGPAYVNSDLGIYKNFRIGDRHNLEARFSMFNFLNHPLKMFGANGDASDLKLLFAAPLAGIANSNPLTTGFPLAEIGRRITEITLKYTF